MKYSNFWLMHNKVRNSVWRIADSKLLFDDQGMYIYIKGSFTFSDPENLADLDEYFPLSDGWRRESVSVNEVDPSQINFEIKDRPYA